MIAIVPIRSGSKGIPNKNVKLFNSKPLVWWVLNSLENSYVDQIIVATDKEYIDVVNSFNFTKVSTYLRKRENSRDTSSTESVLIEVIKNLNLKDDILLAQVTSPLTTSNDFNQGIELYQKYDSVLSGVRQKRFIWDDKGTALNYDFKNRPRRQDWDGYLVENGAFYINSSSNILKYINRLSGKIGIYEMEEVTYYEIDSLDDWIILEGINKLRLK